MAPSLLLEPMSGWATALAAPPHRRHAGTPARLAAAGRPGRPDPGLGPSGLKSYYYFLDVVGRKADDIARVLPRLVAENVVSLAKRAGQKRGWSEVRTTTASGQVVVERFKTFVATWRPAGGVIRVVILKADDDSWRAFLCGDRDATVGSIVQAVHDRWTIEANYRDLKQVERAGEVRSNVGCGPTSGRSTWGCGCAR